MVYNFNLGIGWASSGVEYAQSYRGAMLRNVGIPARFVFTDMIRAENIQRYTENIGFLDEEIIWLYTFFTDLKTAPCSFTLADLEKTFGGEQAVFSRDGKTARYSFSGDKYYKVYLLDEETDILHRVEIVSRGKLIRKDYYSYCRMFSEYYAPLDGKAHLYNRRYFNEDGSVAYEEVIDDDKVFYKFKDAVLSGKDRLVGYMVSKLNLTAEDTVIIDRATGIAPAILRNCGDAKVCVVVHADHFSEGSTDEQNVLWNNYYEYTFSQHSIVDHYIVATDAQKLLMEQQFEKYHHAFPNIVTIPVGSLNELKVSQEPRRKHSLITASRLATEKHCDWLLEAVVEARKTIPDISLDIYGKGGAETLLKELIDKYRCHDYVRLMGQQKLDEIYKQYEAYFSASQSEGFGLTLMEALGSGLPIVGFDVRYGNQNFIDNGKNGYKIPITDDMDKKEKVRLLTEHIIKLFTEDDMESCRAHSYEKAKEYLTSEVQKRWIRLINQK